MKHRHTVLAVPLFVCGAAASGASQAAAVPPGEPDDTRNNQATVEVYVDDTANEVMQTAAGALGGAGLATAGFWFHRRRHPLAAAE